MSHRSILLSTTIAMCFVFALAAEPASAHPGGGAPHPFAAPPQVSHVVANAAASIPRPSSQSAGGSAQSSGSTPNPAGARPVKPAGEGPSRPTSPSASAHNTGPAPTPQSAGARPVKPTGEAPSRGTAAAAGQSSGQSSRPSASNVPLRVPSITGLIAAREVYAGNLTAHDNSPLHPAPAGIGGKAANPSNGTDAGSHSNPETPANNSSGNAAASGTTSGPAAGSNTGGTLAARQGPAGS